MKKKLIITFSVIGGIIALVIILLFTLFGLRYVSLDLRTYNSLFSSEEAQESVISSGKFAYNMPIFFQDKQAYIDNLEKSNPYLKVINIESRFPNTLVVKCVDREEVFAIKMAEDKYFIVDEDLKVLRIENTFTSTQTNAILLSLDSNIHIENAIQAEVGDFLELSADQKLVENISPALKLNNRNTAEQKALFESINVKYRTNPLTARSEAYLELYDFAGVKMSIMEANDSLALKLNCLLAVHAVFDPAEASIYELRVLKNSNGDIFCHQTQKS